MTVRAASAAVLACLALLTGCASGSESVAPPIMQAPGTTTPPAAPVTPTTPASDQVRVAVAIADGTVTPAPANVPVPLGSTVALTVTSDVADEVHVHGYDVGKRVPAGGTVTIELTADQAGTFEVETHDSGLLLLKLVVS